MAQVGSTLSTSNTGLMVYFSPVDYVASSNGIADGFGVTLGSELSGTYNYRKIAVMKVVNGVPYILKTFYNKYGTTDFYDKATEQYAFTLPVLSTVYVTYVVAQSALQVSTSVNDPNPAVNVFVPNATLSLQRPLRLSLGGYAYGPTKPLVGSQASMDNVTLQQGARSYQPKNLNATQGTSTTDIKLNWTAAAGATSYEIWRAENIASLAEKIGTSTTTDYTDVTTATHTVVAGNNYAYVVRGVSSAGNSESSNMETGWMNILAATNLVATNGTLSTGVNLTWTAAAGAGGYRILRGTGSDTPTKLADTGFTNFLDTTAVSGILYTYVVVAMTNAGDSPPSNSYTGWRLIGAPTITSVSPNSGSMNGATAITIVGTNLTGATNVTVGGVAATSVVVVSPTQITAVTPSGEVGAASVALTNLAGTVTKSNAFTFVTTPTITSVSPTSGSTLGGTAFTIVGTNLLGVTSVTVGGVAAKSVVVVSATSITAITPAGAAGAKAIAVTNAGGTATSASAFLYVAPATISSVSPATGSTLGGTAITITGTNFTGASSVKVGGVAVDSFAVVSATSITAVTAASTTVGAKTVEVTTQAGAVSKASAFTYVAPAPTISSVSPQNGSTLGGTAITITGTNFTGAISVKVGGVAATSVVVVSATSITAVTPASTTIGAKTIVVTTPSGSTTQAISFTYFVPAPTISSVTPSSGSTLGGTTITVTGTNLTGATSVKVGGVAATNVLATATSITAKTTAGDAGLKDVAVTTAGGTATKTGAFTYIAPPVITSVTPAIGPTIGGTAITITGTNFTGASSVKIGANAATNLIVNPTSITATTPVGAAGAQKIVVTTPSGVTTQNISFTYVLLPVPTIASVSPTSGSTLGGTTITITGTNFIAGATTVKVGDIAATNVVATATSITAVTPAATAGAKVVQVTTTGGTASKSNAFTYVVFAPTILSVSPSSGSTLGGTQITITGTNFTGATSVKVGGVAATSVVVVSATSITAVTPASTTIGAKTIVVTTPSGSTTQAITFTYVVPAPTISSVTPSSGSTLGATTITIVGTNLTGATSVKIGGVSATNVVVSSATSMTAKTPASAAGLKDVTVTTAGGTATKTGAFTYVASPTITLVTPATGPTSGGTAITITGTNLSGATNVTVNGVAATSVVVVSATSITARTPAGTIGAKSVAVTTAGGPATKASAFTYTAGFTDDGTTPGVNGNSSGDAVASKSGNGNDTSAGQSTSAAESEAAAPMGVELYLQTVALHADAHVVCHDAADATNEIASDFVGPLVSEQVSESNNALLDTSVALSVDANTVAEISAAIDLDHNGVADICQLRGGDLDLDGAITQRDMSILLNMIGLEPVFGIGDMDGNGVLDAADVGMILNQLP